MKKQKKEKNGKKKKEKSESEVVTDKTNELSPKDEPKKFLISLKMQSSLTMEKPQPVEGRKGPKIIIAKSKKEKDDESKKPTKRLNKRRRKKLQQGLPIEETIHETKGQAKALQYLKQWDEDRDSWKFEKCRQIWLLHNAYEKTRVADELFPSLLRYMESIKGGMRSLALDIANKKLKSDETNDDKDSDGEEEKVEDKKTPAKKEITEIEKDRARKVIEILSS